MFGNLRKLINQRKNEFKVSNKQIHTLYINFVYTSMYVYK